MIVAMSGGVDSSVAAYLLKQQGHCVIGLYMRNWEETDPTGVCGAAADYEDVVRVCDHIGIPYYSVNFTKKYWDQVFARCLEEYKKGLTPNPDVFCNREIKFDALLAKAKEMGGALATGHYCRIQEQKGEFQLLKGKDPNKDQSYFLHMVTGQALKETIFPIGNLNKSEVRRIALDAKLPTAKKKDSTGICFIGKRKFKSFLQKYIDIKPGKIENTNGEVVGRHDGVPFYTIGQRKGLQIGGEGKAWYVVGKNFFRNVLIVAQGDEHPALFSDRIEAAELSWISTKGPPPLPFFCQAKIRYRQKEEDCVIHAMENNRALITFSKLQRAPTPGQSVVFYDGDVCLGGGLIVS